MNSSRSLEASEDLVYFAKQGIQIEQTRKTTQNLAW